MSLDDISVVIPCRNERRTLGACLDALDAQDMPRHSFEVLVVDGRSTDGCRAIAEAHGHRVVDDPGRGPAAARNVGIRESRGAIVAFTDADCVPHFDWLSSIAAAFDAEPSVAGVAGQLRLPRSTLIGRIEDNDARTRYQGFITSNIAYRRDVLLEVGGFDELLSCAEDYDLAWRLLDRGHRIARAQAPVVLHDPPEVSGSLSGYLAKQFWYARHDVPAHARAIARATRSADTRAGSAAAVAGAMDALGHSAAFSSAALGIVRRSPRLLAASLGAAAVVGARQAWENVAKLGEGRSEMPAAAALYVAKSLVRGAGTLVGLLSLAHPARWTYLTAPGAGGLAPPSLRAAPAAQGGG